MWSTERIIHLRLSLWATWINQAAYTTQSSFRGRIKIYTNVQLPAGLSVQHWFLVVHFASPASWIAQFVPASRSCGWMYVLDENLAGCVAWLHLNNRHRWSTNPPSGTISKCPVTSSRWISMYQSTKYRNTYVYINVRTLWIPSVFLEGWLAEAAFANKVVKGRLRHSWVDCSLRMFRRWCFVYKS